eukprot:2385295-Amphidinium_carterae.1
MEQGSESGEHIENPVGCKKMFADSRWSWAGSVPAMGIRKILVPFADSEAWSQIGVWSLVGSTDAQNSLECVRDVTQHLSLAS